MRCFDVPVDSSLSLSLLLPLLQAPPPARDAAALVVDTEDNAAALFDEAPMPSLGVRGARVGSSDDGCGADVSLLLDGEAVRRLSDSDMNITSSCNG